MDDNTSTNNINRFQKQKNKEEMKKQLISFALMIGFTLIAFGVVIADAMDKTVLIPFIILLAITQVAFQFFYFMHMKDKGHKMISLVIIGGVWAAMLALAGLITITWW